MSKTKAYINLAKNILASNFTRLSFPYKLTFAITYRCNYKCKTCNIWKRKPEDELTLDEITEFFQKSNKFNWIDFTGGEIWLRNDFTNIVEVALRQCKNLVLLHFPTNGYMTEKIIRGVEHIIKMRPPKLIITVSVDGDEAINDQIRGIRGGWRRQLETYRRLHNIPGIQVVLGMTLSSFNEYQYDKAFEAVKAECPWLKPSDFHMNFAHESPHYYDNVGINVLDNNKVIEQLSRYNSLRGFPLNPIDIIEKRYIRYAERYLRTGITPMRCHAIHSSCFIDPWGDVYPCGMYNVKIANLRNYNYDLQTIWNLYYTQQLQKEIWNYKCPQCWTPCEAYQSIYGNLFLQRNTLTNQNKARPKLKMKDLNIFSSSSNNSSQADVQQ